MANLESDRAQVIGLCRCESTYATPNHLCSIRPRAALSCAAQLSLSQAGPAGLEPIAKAGVVGSPNPRPIDGHLTI